MKRIAFLIFVLGAFASAQSGYRYDGIAVKSTGIPAAGATITVCGEPASGTPCTPISSIFSDQGLSTPKANPFTADTVGNFGFYAASGLYHVQISGTGVTTYDLPYINLGGFNSSPQNINNVLYANRFSGSDIGAQINACLVALPSTGGVCDARGFQGTFTNATNPVSGLAGKSFTLLLDQVTINDSSCWIFPNDGTSLPNQGNIRIIGAGYDAASVPAGKTPTSGTIINNSCNTGVAKFDTRGAGTMEVAGITFRDSTGDSLPFWQTTNTILLFHDNQFYGSKNGTANNQDCIILGGTTQTLDGSSTAAFQGYGTYIEHNFFNHIRRAVYGRVFSNAINVNANTVWEQAGSNLSGGAAIEFVDSSGTASNAGNVFRGNLIEVINYVYGIKFSTNGVNNTLSGNNIYDGNLGVTFVAGIRFELGSTNNLIEQGFQNDTYPGISEDVGSLGTNTFITTHQSKTSVFPQLYKFTAGGGLKVDHATVGGEMYNAKVDTTNDEFYNTISTAGKPQYNLFIHPAGGTGVSLASWEYYSATQAGLKLSGSVESFMEAVADLRVRATGGFNLWLGTNTTPDVLLIGDSLLRANQHLVFKTDNTFDIGASGATRPRTLYLGTGIAGVTNGSSAAAGIVGEVIPGQQLTPQSLTSTVALGITSMLLTAGDWDVYGNVQFTGTSTTVTMLRSGISTVPNAYNDINPDGCCSGSSLITGTAIAGNYLNEGPFRVSISSPATYYLTVDATFGSGTALAAGTIRARRIR